MIFANDDREAILQRGEAGIGGKDRDFRFDGRSGAGRVVGDHRILREWAAQALAGLVRDGRGGSFCLEGRNGLRKASSKL